MLFPRYDATVKIADPLYLEGVKSTPNTWRLVFADVAVLHHLDVHHRVDARLGGLGEIGRRVVAFYLIF